MKRSEIRLECLKLAHRHDRSPAQVIIDAQIFEEYILKPSDESEKTEGVEVNKRGPGRPRKNVENAEDILS